MYLVCTQNCLYDCLTWNTNDFLKLKLVDWDIFWYLFLQFHDLEHIDCTIKFLQTHFGCILSNQV